MPGHYYCRINGDQVGPLSAKKVRDLIQCGVLQDTDAVRKAPHGRWISVADGKKRFGGKSNKKKSEPVQNTADGAQQESETRVAEEQPTTEASSEVGFVAQPTDPIKLSAGRIDASPSLKVDSSSVDSSPPSEVLDASATASTEEPPAPRDSQALAERAVIDGAAVETAPNMVVSGFDGEAEVVTEAEVAEGCELEGAEREYGEIEDNLISPSPSLAFSPPEPSPEPAQPVGSVNSESTDDGISADDIVASLGIELAKDSVATEHPVATKDIGESQPNEAPNATSRQIDSPATETLNLQADQLHDGPDEKCPADAGHVDPPVAESRFKTLLRNQYARAALLVNFVVVPFLVPEFGPNLAPSFSFGFAILSLLVGGAIYSMVCLPNPRAQGWAFAGAIFIGIFGTSTLIQFEELAVAIAPEDVTIPTSPLWLVQMMGTAFLHLMTEMESGSSSNFMQLLVSAVLSAGLCEETLKLIPVAVAIGCGYARNHEDKQGILYLGAICGIAFGVSEGLWLTLDDAPGGVSLSAHLTHFLGRAGGHAAFTLVAASLLLFFAKRVKNLPVWKLVGITALTGFILAIPHGLYDALLIYRMPGLAGLAMLSLVWIVLIASDPKLPHAKTAEV